MRKIPLSGKLGSGKHALVDSSEYENLQRHRWYLHHTGYAVTFPRGTRKMLLMHRLVAKTPPGKFTDHKNHDRLDNRTSNLRVCSQSQNQFNRSLDADNKSGCKGVYWHKPRSKWRSQIVVRGINTHLGIFSDLGDAIKARKEAESKFHGKFAYEYQ